MFTFSLANYNCKIKVVSTTDGEIPSLGYLDVIRQEDGDETETIVYTKSIAGTTTEDFNFTFIDRYTLSNRTYTYTIRVYTYDFIEYTFLEEQSATIECSFDGIYIYDESDEYILELNVDFDFDNNVNVFYQGVLQSKYPIRVQNGLTDYRTGHVEGLPLDKDSNGKYITDGAYLYKKNYMSWLRNSLSKYIKTWKGDAVYASVDPGVKMNQTDAYGAETVRFTFTEIGDTPTYES